MLTSIDFSYIIINCAKYAAKPILGTKTALKIRQKVAETAAFCRTYSRLFGGAEIDENGVS